MFVTYQTLNCRGKLIDLQTPKIMGIININQDSFYKKSRTQSIDETLFRAEEMVNEGVHFFDVGAMSSRPGAELISIEEETNRLDGIVQALGTNFPHIPVSVDTIHSKVAKKVLEEGAAIINDISGGTFDEDMMETVGAFDAPFVAMHMKGRPKNMQLNPVYDNVVTEVFDYFVARINEAEKVGIVDLILDPGFGFAKNVTHNFQLLHFLDGFEVLRYPLLVGVSRKSFIQKTVNANTKEALNGTTAVHMLALMKGARILRVHDVREAVEAVKIWENFNSQQVVEMKF